MNTYHAMTKNDVLAELNITEQGLTSQDALLRLKKYGENELPEKKKRSRVGIFLEQFKNYLIFILLVAAVIEIFIGKYTEAFAIFIVLLVNATLGYTQEYKAQTSIEALRRISAPKAKVLRDQVRTRISTSKVVPGDIIFLETGDKVPADARLLEIVNLAAQESSLTGESIPVEKTIEALAIDLQIDERKNMVFQGTVIVKGRGRAVVTSTGINTEIGKIAQLIQSKEESTPLEKKLEQLGKHIGYAVGFICILVFIIGFFRGEEKFNLFLTTVSLAVAAIPEGLPIVVTLTSAIGIQRMAKKNALIRRLPSVETLGSTTVICTDKTGTLTYNQMTVKKIYANREVIEVTGEGYSTEGKFSKDPKDFDVLLKAGALCNDASITGQDFGDPTEIALLVCAAKAGQIKDELEKKNPRTSEISFTSERKYMITVHGNIAYAKGAPDILLNLCDSVLINGKPIKLTIKEKEEILNTNEMLAGDALRVLGFAYKQGEFSEKGFIFLGLQGMMDPPRKEVKEEIQKCRNAGIKVVMITGDHPSTAAAVGKQIGLEVKILSGRQIDELPDLNSVVEDIIIFARVSPEHKLRIVEALKSHGHIVAMTGDGVNDAPALKKADIGIAMGISGTDVAKEASDMILSDDNFKSIVSAVEEGRGIYENINKFLRFQLSTNAGAIITVFIGTLAGLPLPLTALQLLWINVIVDGPPALSLSVEPLDPESMKKPPRDPREQILSRKMLRYVFATGSMMAIGTLMIFSYMLSLEAPKAQTLAFTTFVFFQLFNVLNCRSDIHSIFEIGFFSNRTSILSITAVILVQAAIVYFPQVQGVFGTVPLSLKDWLFSVVVASSIFIAFEILKSIKNRKKNDPSTFVANSFLP
ncbi:MAG: calcium-transporting P-type ATPase, PMR1-type [Candidatus Methanoperedens sp.]|nr:calcium-transporting P-type ATPase, PMR1-type [Candidatus Methanoperedens sp.]